MSLFHRCCAFRLVVVATDVVAFVAADVFLVVHFHVVCVVADITVVRPDVSGFLLEAVDVLLTVVGVLAFVFVVLFYVFGTLLHVAGFVVVLMVVFLLMVRAFLLKLLVDLPKFLSLFTIFSFPFSIKCKLSL